MLWLGHHLTISAEQLIPSDNALVPNPSRTAHIRFNCKPLNPGLSTCSFWGEHRGPGARCCDECVHDGVVPLASGMGFLEVEPVGEFSCFLV